jgi:ComF family protein
MPLLEDLRAIVNGLCPECCPRCDEPCASGFCQACREGFARVRDPCARCGLPGPCRHCPALTRGWQITAVRAPFAYAPPLARYLQAHKYSRQRPLGRVLGQLLRFELESTGIDCDAIVAVPLHARRLRDRGFNQADEIARPVARALGLPLMSTRVKRGLNTQTQVSLDRHQRIKSMPHAFSADGKLAGLKIAIVDDVITTGATINALANALMSAGAVRAEAWAVLRTIDRDARRLSRP